MLNYIDNTDLPNQIRNLFIWFIKESTKIWQDYEYDLYMESSEETNRLTQQLLERRKELIKDGLESFLYKDYINLVETLLNTLDKNLENARLFYFYPDYYLKSIDTYLDCYSTIGAHSYIDTIIFDSIENVNKVVILNKYISLLNKQAKALFEYEDEIEMVWDNVYFINLKNDPSLFYFGDLSEHKK